MNDPRLRILFVSGDRDGGGMGVRLAYEREFEEIEDAIRRSNHRDQIEQPVSTCLAATRESLSARLSRLPPDTPSLIHFTGHGLDRRLVLLTGDRTRTETLTEEQALQIFADLPQVRLVVLSACHSLALARRLIECVDFAVGTGGAMPDTEASRFAKNFYEFLCNGESIQAAHARAHSTLSSDLADERKPQLVCRDGGVYAVHFGFVGHRWEPQFYKWKREHGEPLRRPQHHVIQKPDPSVPAPTEISGAALPAPQAPIGLPPPCLLDILADLYHDKKDAQRIAHAAGLNTRHIDFDGALPQVWRNVVAEAEATALLPELVEIARREYPGRNDLTDASHRASDFTSPAAELSVGDIAHESPEPGKPRR